MVGEAQFQLPVGAEPGNSGCGTAYAKFNDSRTIPSGSLVIGLQRERRKFTVFPSGHTRFAKTISFLCNKARIALHIFPTTLLQSKGTWTRCHNFSRIQDRDTSKKWRGFIDKNEARLAPGSGLLYSGDV